MPRNMSFTLTVKQIKNKTKTVTRRLGWWFLRPGDVLNAVEKSMGLKKGEKIKRIGKIEVVSTRPERLREITKGDCVREGFKSLTPEMFFEMLRLHFGKEKEWNPEVNRIEFKYLAN